jgi:hypothetical protein
MALTDAQRDMKTKIYHEVYGGSRRERPRMTQAEAREKYGRYCRLLREAGIPRDTSPTLEHRQGGNGKAPSSSGTDRLYVQPYRNEWSGSWIAEGYH